MALARSILRKGANFTAAMAFEFASTNLVIELGIILWLLVGWRFALAEFVRGPIMVIILALLFRAFLTRGSWTWPGAKAEKGLRGSMEGHAEMDMSVTGGSILSRITPPKGFTSIGEAFGQRQLHLQSDQLLLGPVVDVALQPPPLLVLGGDDALAGRSELLQAGQELLGQSDVPKDQPPTRGEILGELLLSRGEPLAGRLDQGEGPEQFSAMMHRKGQGGPKVRQPLTGEG